MVPVVIVVVVDDDRGHGRHGLRSVVRCVARVTVKAVVAGHGGD